MHWEYLIFAFDVKILCFLHIFQEIDYTADLCIKEVQRLREMSPLWEMIQEGTDLKSIEWNQNWVISPSVNNSTLSIFKIFFFAEKHHRLDVISMPPISRYMLQLVLSIIAESPKYIYSEEKYLYLLMTFIK